MEKEKLRDRGTSECCGDGIDQTQVPKMAVRELWQEVGTSMLRVERYLWGGRWGKKAQ